MPVEKMEKDIATLVAHVDSGEIKLPEIQRAYVWKPTQVAKLVESLYRGYPTGSLLFWRTTEAPETKAIASNAPSGMPAVPPLYLLDGQQRLTSLHRVMTDHEEAQIVFNVETQAFQNQSAATSKDQRWVKVHDLFKKDAKLFEVWKRFEGANLRVDHDVVGHRLQQLMSVPKYMYHMEVIAEMAYEEVAQIFVRVNSGGRSLRTSDLALATLSARWKGVVAKLETEAEHWRGQGYGDLDITFLTRALTGAVLGRGLSAWSHSRLVAATNAELEKGWATVQRGLRDLIPLLKSNLGVSHSSLMPSIAVLLPLVVLLGERATEKIDEETASGILYWFLVATVSNRYSGSTDTLLGQDIPAAREPEPVKALLANLGLGGATVEVTPQLLAGRTVASPYFFLSYLIARQHGAKDWFHAIGIDLGAQGAHKLEYHHIHPRATLKDLYSKPEINDLANLAFISSKANKTISDRSPAIYFPDVGDATLTAHLVPLEDNLRTAGAYPQFLAARRALLAGAMTALLNRFRPEWLDAVEPQPSDDLEGCALEFVRYESGWDQAKIYVHARDHDTVWQALLSADALEDAIAQAESGISSDLQVGNHQLAVRSENDTIDIEFGPFLASGSATDWKSVIDRERTDTQALSKAPVVAEPAPWDAPRRRFPVTASE